jgi:hypothetical protein
LDINESRQSRIRRSSSGNCQSEGCIHFRHQYQPIIAATCPSRRDLERAISHSGQLEKVHRSEHAQWWFTYVNTKEMRDQRHIYLD